MCRVIHKDKDLDSDVKSEEDDDDKHPCGGEGKQSSWLFLISSSADLSPLF